MAEDKPKESSSKGNPVATFRTSWQMFQLLDSLAQLEGSSRSRIINAALWQYAEDYMAVRGRTIPNSLRNKLRRIDILHKRIQVNLQLGETRVLEDLQENRKDMLDEAYHYARYASNTDSFQLLSRTAEWLAHTFENATPAPKAQTNDLMSLLKTLIEGREAEAEAPEADKGAE